MNFLIRRPAVLIKAVEHDSKKQCVLSDESDAGKAQITLFAKYYLKAPGHNKDDLKTAHLPLPENCQDFLAGNEQRDPEDVASNLEESTEALEAEKSSGSLMQFKSERLRDARQANQPLQPFGSACYLSCILICGSKLNRRTKVPSTAHLCSSILLQHFPAVFSPWLRGCGGRRRGRQQLCPRYRLRGHRGGGGGRLHLHHCLPPVAIGPWLPFWGR